MAPDAHWDPARAAARKSEAELQEILVLDG